MKNPTAVLAFTVVILSSVCAWLSLSRHPSERFTHIGLTNAATFIMFDQRTKQACWSGPRDESTALSTDGSKREYLGDAAAISSSQYKGDAPPIEWDANGNPVSPPASSDWRVVSQQAVSGAPGFVRVSPSSAQAAPRPKQHSQGSEANTIPFCSDL